jgi:hypothetical protein
VPSKNLSMGTWEHRNKKWFSPPLHNSPRYLLLGEMPQNTKRNKKRGFYESPPTNILEILKP